MEDRFQSTALCHTNMTVHATTAVAAPIAPPGFCNRGEVRYGSIWGLEYEVPQSQLYCLCINLTLCSTAVQCICRVIRRSSMTFYTYCIIFGRQPIGGKLPPFPPGGATGRRQAVKTGRSLQVQGRSAWSVGNRKPERCISLQFYTCMSASKIREDILQFYGKSFTSVK